MLTICIGTVMAMAGVWAALGVASELRATFGPRVRQVRAWAEIAWRR